MRIVDPVQIGAVCAANLHLFVVGADHHPKRHIGQRSDNVVPRTTRQRFQHFCIVDCSIILAIKCTVENLTLASYLYAPYSI